jgi:UPF0755 protein
MSRDGSEWPRDDERLSADQYRRRSPAGSPPDPYGSQDGYRPQVPSARHAEQADAYGPPDSFGPPDSTGPPDSYGRPDPYGQRDRYGQRSSSGPPEPYGQPDRQSQTDPFGTREAYAQPHPFDGQNGPARPDRRPGQDDAYPPRDPHARPDPLRGHDDFGRRDPRAARDDTYDPPDAVSQTDPFGGQNGFARQPASYGEPDPRGAGGHHSQPGRRARQDPLGGPGGHGPDDRAQQDRQRGRGDNGLTESRGRHGGGQQDPYGSLPGRPGPGGSASEAPSSGPYRWRPPADRSVQEFPPQADPRDGDRIDPLRSGQRHLPSVPDHAPPPGPDSDRRPRREQREWGQASGEQVVWPEPVSHNAGWREPAGGQTGWHEPVPDETGWHEPVADETGWREPVRPHPAWQQPADEQVGWQEPVRDDDSWQDEGEPDSGFLPGFSHGADDGRRPGRRPKRRRIRWAAPLVAFIVILAALGGAGNYLFRRYEASHANYLGQGTGSVIVHVLPGDSPFSLAPRLISLGVIKATDPFKAAAKDSSSLAVLEPGYFRLHKHMNAALAYAALINPKSRIQVTVTIPEGQRDSQVVSALSAKTGIAASQFTKVLKHPVALGLPAYASGNPEGYLFPATYNVQPQATATSILQQMVQSFDQEATTINLAAAAKRARISESHVIIVASLVQAEGGRLQDFPKIAQVIYNRLNTGMQLELDSTVMFAMNKYGIRATIAQTHFSSPYNTYVHAGLPPGPIDSPGDAAIKAALHPAAGNWRYFVTVDPKTGLTKFTNSPLEFQHFVAELDRNLQNGT